MHQHGFPLAFRPRVFLVVALGTVALTREAPLIKTISFLLCLLSASAFAQTPMKSFVLWSQTIPCNNEDQLMPLDPAGNALAPPAIPAGGPGPGHASFPSGNFFIRSVCVNHHIIGGNTDYSYAVAGHWGENGNDMTPRFSGSGFACKDYPVEYPVVFTVGEYINIHASCSGGKHWATMQVWYTDH